MSIEQFIREMPKVDLHLEFEGALPKETLMLVADESNLISTMKQREYNEIVGYINRPEPKKYDDIARILAGWLKYPEDLSRTIYDIGLKLHKQQVRYAEVFISPALYTDNGLTFEQFMDGINDGSDRLFRAWKIRLNWILTIPRDRPRKGDDIARWATSATARKGHVIGLGLSGREDANPSAQFTKAFTTVQRKDLMTVCHMKTLPHTESVLEIMNALAPTRVNDIWGLSVEDVALLSSRGGRVVVTPTRDLRLGRYASLSAYPFRLLADNLSLSLGSGMPELYRTTLTDEYLNLTQAFSLQIDDIIQLSMNSISNSFLTEDEKADLKSSFQAEYDTLREKYGL